MNGAIERNHPLVPYHVFDQKEGIGMILDQIVQATKLRVQHEKQLISEQEYKNIARGQSIHSVEEMLRRPGMHIICEIKKASPSKGIIAHEFDYCSIAKEYEAAGASLISVLTEPEFFLGELRYLTEVHETVSTPLLRKDFIIDSYQIYQAIAAGASCVLLICAILSESQLREYISICGHWGLAALVEVHDVKEAELAQRCGARIIGINNRNLKDFSVDFTTSIQLQSHIDKEIVCVAESGVQTASQVKQLYDANFHAILVGETIMRSKNKADCIRELLSEVQSFDANEWRVRHDDKH